MRIPDKLLFQQARIAQERQAERFEAASRVASSGLKVERPSDGAPAWTASVRLRTTAAGTKERRAVAQRASSDLQIADGALGAATDRLVRARELAVQMNNGSVSAADRANAAKEIDSIREDLLSLANTKGDRGYLFGGTATGSPPFASTGVFSGNDNPFSIPLAEGTTANVAPSGARAFTAAGGRDVFADLAALSTALSTNNLTAINTSLDQLAQGQRQITDVRADTGMALGRLQSAIEVGENAEIRLREASSHTVEADVIEAYGELSSAQTAFERGVEVTKRILSLSSLNRG